MANIDPNYIKDLERYLNTDEDTREPREEIVVDEGLKGNITNDEVRASTQALLYIVVDKSGSMFNNGLEKGVIKGLEDVKRVVNGSEESRTGIETAMTFFGSTLDMRPFKYGECIDTSYKANESKTRLYDAIVESCKNMIAQYDKLDGDYKVKGSMVIFTDGEENGSEQYNLQDVQSAFEELRSRDIKYLVAAFNGVDLSKLSKDLCVEPFVVKNDHQLRRLLEFTSLKAMA